MSDITPPNPADVPNDSESFGIVRNDSESFGKVPNSSENFGNLRNHSERTDNHTLTVREVARTFEDAGVARTERSIINWCQPNPQGVARLSAFYDVEERRWFITRESAQRVIAEERAKAERASGKMPPPKSDHIPHHSETNRPSADSFERGKSADGIKALEQEVIDLRITNRGKDYFIEQLQKERDSFAQERRDYVEKLMAFNRKVGELETKLLQLGAPEKNSNDSPSHAGEGDASPGATVSAA